MPSHGGSFLKMALQPQNGVLVISNDIVVGVMRMHRPLGKIEMGKNIQSTLFPNFLARVFLSAKYGQILYQDDINFHLSHQPPLYIMCCDLVIRMGLFIICVSAISTLLLHTFISKMLHISYRVG